MRSTGSDALVAGEASAVIAVDDAAVDLEDGVATTAVVSSASSRGVSGALGDIARVDEAVVGGSTVGASGDGGLHSALNKNKYQRGNLDENGGIGGTESRHLS